MSMNIFRLAGDMTHLVSILVLMLKIRAMRSCAGESGRWFENRRAFFCLFFVFLFFGFSVSKMLTRVCVARIPELNRRQSENARALCAGVHHAIFGPLLSLHIIVRQM